eukprot:592981-Pelagomonas_calceolata.AAC.2
MDAGNTMFSSGVMQAGRWPFMKCAPDCSSAFRPFCHRPLPIVGSVLKTQTHSPPTPHLSLHAPLHQCTDGSQSLHGAYKGARTLRVHSKALPALQSSAAHHGPVGL